MEFEYDFTDSILRMIGAPSYQKETIEEYIEEVIEYMVDSGVPREVAISRKAKGTVTRGVNDLWNYTSGDTKYSPAFKERVTQLAYSDTIEVIVTEHEKYHISNEEIKKIVGDDNE